MKKKFFSIFAVAAIITAALTINSCTKQESEQAVMNTTTQTQMTAQDAAILNSIITFKEKIEYIQANPGYKSGEEVEVDSAVWYLDATLNLSHAFISWTPMSNFYTDSVFVTIPKSGEMVDMDDLAAAYTELKQKVADVCIAAPGNDKELYIASLSKKEETTNDITIKVYSTIGNRSTPPDNTPFDEGWMYGDTLGNCAYPPQFIGEDACTKLRDKTNLYRYLYIDDEQMIYISTPGEDPYVTIHSEKNIFENPDDPGFDNYYEHLLIYQEKWYGYHDCISKEEMNWYYHKLHYVVYDMVPNNQQEWPNAYGKTFISIITDPDPDYGTYGTKTSEIIRHQYKIEYRTGIYVGENGEPESIVQN